MRKRIESRNSNGAVVEVSVSDSNSNWTNLNNVSSLYMLLFVCTVVCMFDVLNLCTTQTWCYVNTVLCL
jgi:hypothetical protein